MAAQGDERPVRTPTPISAGEPDGSGESMGASALLSDDLVALLRHRIASRYYDQPRTVDALARRLVRLGSS